MNRVGQLLQPHGTIVAVGSGCQHGSYSRVRPTLVMPAHMRHECAELSAKRRSGVAEGRTPGQRACERPRGASLVWMKNPARVGTRVKATHGVWPKPCDITKCGPREPLPHEVWRRGRAKEGITGWPSAHSGNDRRHQQASTALSACHPCPVTLTRPRTAHQLPPSSAPQPSVAAATLPSNVLSGLVIQKTERSPPGPALSEPRRAPVVLGRTCGGKAQAEAQERG